jgi:hypothetical protein
VESDPWFDDDCRVAKRSVLLFERPARQAVMVDATTASATWRDRRCAYRQLLQMKRETFWQSTIKITAKRSSPRELWQSIDELLGREHTPLSSAVDADEILQFFDEKVAILFVRQLLMPRHRCFRLYRPVALCVISGY